MYVLTRASKGCPHDTHTNGTAYTRGTYSSYTHKHTHKHKQTHSAARQSTVCGLTLTPWRRPHQRRAPAASPPPPATANCISVAISHAEAMCTATERRCACSASHVDVNQLTPFSYCTAGAAGSACSALKPYSSAHCPESRFAYTLVLRKRPHRSVAIFLVR
jgi:hypothetical protein